MTTLQQSLIEITEVDNSAKSTNPFEQPNYLNNGINEYACENTYDKVFLLSGEEITNRNYGFNAAPDTTDIARRKSPSAYAQCQGCYKESNKNSEYYGKGRWWLRSPYFWNSYGNSWVHQVSEHGYDSYNNVYYMMDGVVPALQLKLA